MAQTDQRKEQTRLL